MNYEFTDTFQDKILAVLWRDSENFPIYKECVKPRYFKNNVNIDVCRIIFEYWEKYSQPPTLDVLIEEVSYLLKSSKVKANLKKDYISLLSNLSEFDLEDLYYIKDKIIDFGKRQAIIEAVVESAKLIEKNKDGNYYKVEKLIKEALRVGEDITNMGIDVFENIEERFEKYIQSEDVVEHITTGSQELDKIMKGGLGKTEVGVVIAPPGRGKTTFLIDKGAEAVKAGYNVVHYTFENSDKKIVRNYDMRLIEKDFEYIKENIEASTKALGNIRKYKKGNLVVKKFPPKTVMTSTLKAHIQQLTVVKNFKPDLIIVDYGALLKPTNIYTDKRFSLEEIFEELAALADELNVALWTGAQGNRASLSKKIVTIQDLAECFAIANISDFMLALCQTKKEKNLGKMRFFIAKQRDAEDYITFEGKILYDIKKIIIESRIDTLDDEDEDEENEENWEESC